VPIGWHEGLIEVHFESPESHKRQCLQSAASNCWASCYAAPHPSVLPFSFPPSSPRFESFYPNDRLYVLKARCIPATCCTEIKKIPSAVLCRLIPRNLVDYSMINLALLFASLTLVSKRTSSVKYRH